MVLHLEGKETLTLKVNITMFSVMNQTRRRPVNAGKPCINGHIVIWAGREATQEDNSKAS
jgi:hypothetical protein